MLFAIINVQIADWYADRAIIIYSNILAWVVLVSVGLIGIALIMYHIYVGPWLWG